MRATIYFTSKDGSSAEILGDDKALDAVERAFERAGIRFDEQVETWDEGFYQTPGDQALLVRPHRSRRKVV